MLAACAVALAQEAEDPAAILLGKSLKPAGTVWLNKQEWALRTRFDELDRLESRRQDIQGKINAFIQLNEAARAQFDGFSATLEKLRGLAAAAPAGSSARRQRDEDVKRQQTLVDKLRKQVIAPLEFGASPPVKAAMLELIAARDELGLAMLDIRSLTAGLDESYEQLRRDPEVAVALERLGPQHRLGPVKNYHSELKRLSKLEPLVFTAEGLMYRESGKFRVSAILNESVPAIFSWSETSEPAVIPASLAQALGIEIDPAAQRITQRTPDGRELSLQAVKIPKLRIGKVVVENVEAFVLPPEGEDQGARLGAISLRDYAVTLEPHLLRLTLKKI